MGRISGHQHLPGKAEWSCFGCSYGGRECGVGRVVMVNEPWYYALRLTVFCLIGYGSVTEFFYVIWRIMCELVDLFGKEVE